MVAPLAGSVDRNADDWAVDKARPRVAPLAGSVDRNQLCSAVSSRMMCRSPRGERG